ncbi:MAG: ABC transporter permease, partial [Anaerovoracaceae bacterium]
EILPILKEDADRDAFGRRLEEFCEKAEGTVCVSFEDTDRQIEESFAQINLLAWGLILFVGLIGILNIINTVSTNIHTRKAEIGMQRAVGMSISSLYRTFLWEGAYYGIISSVIGAAAGYICTVLIESAKTGSAELPGFAFLPTAQAALLATAACLLATCIPLRQVSRMSAAEIVGSVE